MSKDDGSTQIITDIHAALAEADKEAEMLPAALLVIGGDLNGNLYDLDENGTFEYGEIELYLKEMAYPHLDLSDDQLQEIFA